MRSYLKKQNLLLVMMLLLVSFSFGQKIVHLDGSFDLDGDNLLEFISLEIDPSKKCFSYNGAV